MLYSYLAKQGINIPSFTGPPARSKPYQTFEDFYPFYLSQHQDPTCRLLHIAGTSLIVVLLALSQSYEPSLLPSLVAAAGVGYAMFFVLIGLQHGFIELLLTLLSFLILNKALGGRTSAALAVPLIGYSFAWVGHFFYEGNKPATFIYPVFSLAGDFTMWFRVITGAEPLDPATA